MNICTDKIELQCNFRRTLLSAYIRNSIRLGLCRNIATTLEARTQKSSPSSAATTALRWRKLVAPWWSQVALQLLVVVGRWQHWQRRHSASAPSSAAATTIGRARLSHRAW